MKIRIVDSKLKKLEINPTTEVSDELDFSFSPSTHESDSTSYFITFNLSFFHREGYKYVISYVSQFATDDDISDEFMDSPFIKINSPAIAYPFLRAYVANLMLSSGHDPMMLPTVNFTTFKASI